MSRSQIYIVGSLRNIPAIREFSTRLRAAIGDRPIVVTDDWVSHGPDPDVRYHEYCRARNYTYSQAMQNPVAQSVYMTDRTFIDNSAAVIMLQPCGPSAALELGYATGRGKVTVIIKASQDYDKVDIMESFATIISDDQESFFARDLDNLIDIICG